MNVARLRRVARKPPRYLAWRLREEARRELDRLTLERAKRGSGPLAARRLPADARGIDEIAPWARGDNASAGEADARAQRAGGAAAEARCGEDVRARGARALAREVELFGDAPVAVGIPPRWHEDVRSGYGWPRDYHRQLDYRNPGRPSDVKVAWELSRLRHVVALAQAAADPACAAAADADLADWRRQNPVGFGVNWACAMEVALRAVNLICADGLLRSAGARYDRRALVASLYEHGWFLRRNLEISDVNGNHYLADAVGLVWLGRAFAGAGESARWWATGLEMVRRAADEQVLADGLDHEGSLSYHLLVTELFVVARMGAGDALADLDGTLARMLDAAATVCGPDGRVPDLGDDDGGRVLALSDTPSRDARRVLGFGAEVLGRPAVRAAAPRHFGTAGLVVLGGGDDHVVLDAGPVGFRGRGGHGHLDAMSFEATLHGTLAVRDSGTATYTGDPELRNALRGVEAHSGVVVDGRPYAQLGGVDALWAIHGDSPPEVLDVSEHRVQACQRLPGDAVHERSLHWQPGALTVTDDVEAPPNAQVCARLQLPDGCHLVPGGVAGAHSYAVELPPDATLALEPCVWSQRYGSTEPGTRAIVRWTGPGRLSWRIGAR